jgi:hypothetical protein
LEAVLSAVKKAPGAVSTDAPPVPSSETTGPVSSAEDTELLAALGYEQKFDRKVSLWGNFALGFVYLSPLVGVVSLFAVGLSAAGPR